MTAAVKQNKCNLSRNFERQHLRPFELFNNTGQHDFSCMDFFN